MPRLLQWCFGLLITALLFGGPALYYWRSQSYMRNFRVVEDGVLYRSGQMSLDGLKQVLHDYEIRTVVTLRDAYAPGEGPPDREEEAYCRSQDILYVRIPPRAWEAASGPAPVEEGIRKFRGIMADPKNYPVLVHCFAGIHRTGAYVAVFRMEHDHWTNAQAIAEVKACGYSNLDEELDILGYLERYRPTWKEPEPDTPQPEAPARIVKTKHKKKRAAALRQE